MHEYFANDSVNLRLQGVCSIVESEHGRDDRTAELTSAEHVAQVNTPQRHLAGHQNDAPVLLEADIGGTKKQVFREAVGDTGQCLHAAGHDDHSIGHKGAAGDDSRIIALCIDMICGIIEFLNGNISFQTPGESGAFCHNQICFAVCIAEGTEKRETHLYTGGSAYTDDDSHNIPHFMLRSRNQ